MASIPPMEPIADVTLTPAQQWAVVKRWRRGVLAPDTMTPDERRVVQAQLFQDALARLLRGARESAA